MIGPRFAEQVEYLFNYAPSEFTQWTRFKFFGSPARSFATSYALFLSGALLVVLLLKREDE